MEPGESYQEATLREVKEEVGLDVTLLKPNQPDWVQDISSSDKQFMILTSAGVLTSDTVHPNKEDIISKWFDCDEALISSLDHIE